MLHPLEVLRSHAIPIPRNHPYKGVDVDARHDFENSTESSKMRKTVMNTIGLDLVVNVALMMYHTQGGFKYIQRMYGSR